MYQGHISEMCVWLLLLSLSIATTDAVLCRDFTSTDILQGYTTCDAYLDEMGAGSFVLDTRIEASQLQSCLRLKSIQHTLSPTSTVSCHCQSGFTDFFNNSDTGVFRDIKVADLNDITCTRVCPLTYTKILNLQDSALCSCVNKVGCLFSDRNFHRYIPPNTVSIIQVQDNLKEETSFFPCKQYHCKKSVDMVAVNMCVRFGVEFVFCGQCPITCQGEHMECEVDDIYQHCVVKCQEGHYLSGKDESLHCIECVSCGKNEFVEEKCNLANNTRCKACELGTHAPYGKSGDTCIPCPHKSTTNVEGGECFFCGVNYVVSHGKCVKCNVPASSVLQPDAATCADVMDANQATSMCDAGYEWNSDIPSCVPCRLNEFSSVHTGFVCQRCPLHSVTDKIASEECRPCEDIYTRRENDDRCVPCDPGMHVEKIGHQRDCVQCRANTISVEGGSACADCDVLFYSDSTNTECLQCGVGKIRHNNSDACEYCPSGSSLVDNTCVQCHLPASVLCDAHYYSVDDCTTKFPCTCGCVPCPWLEFMATQTDENLLLSPPCTLYCNVGYRLVYSTTPTCVRNQVFYTENFGSYGMFFFDSTDSTDLLPKTCLSAFFLSEDEIRNTTGMIPCVASGSAGTPQPASKTVLMKYVIPETRGKFLDNDCFFCCVSGRKFVFETLDYKLLTCLQESECGKSVLVYSGTQV